MDTSVLEMLNEIKLICEDNEDNKKILNGQISRLTLDGAVYDCYITKRFILFAVPEEGKDPRYKLSFCINNYKIEDVAFYTNIMTLYIYDNLDIYTDHFIDKKTYTAVFGDDAYILYKQQLHEKNGATECPVCQKVVLKELFVPELGYCAFCEEEIPSSTFH